MMLFVVTFATINAVNVSKTWNISQFIGSIIGEFNFPLTWLELRGQQKWLFWGSKRSHTLPPRFGGNFPSNVGWETDHLASMNGPIFRCEITERYLSKKKTLLTSLLSYEEQKPKHRLFAISDFIRKIMTRHDSYDLQDPDTFTNYHVSRIPFSVHDPSVWLIPMDGWPSWWVLQALSEK